MRTLGNISRACVWMGLALWLAMSPLARQCTAAPPQPGEYSRPEFEVEASRGHLVKMRDGVRLSVDLYLPKTTAKVPALLSHIPYSNNTAGAIVRAKFFASRGYAVALSDVRGRFDSEGDWDPFDRKHKTDGYDLVEWLAAQPYCSGKVGMFGLSYMGWAQWWTATQRPPHLVAIVPEVAPPDHFANAPYQQGVLTGWLVDWAAAVAGRTGQIQGDGPYGGFTTTHDKDFRLVPYLTLTERRGAMAAPWYKTWIENNLSTHEYWQAIAYQTPENYARVAVPSLNITGWFDANYPGSPMNYLGMKQHGATEPARRPRLIIGPWMHVYNGTRKLSGVDFGEQAVLDMNGYICRYLDHHLQGARNGLDDDPPVHLFVMGRNAWRSASDWPLPGTQWTKFFLHSKGRANTVTGDGSLSTEPQGDEPADAYTYDPEHPTPSPFTGGHIDGPSDTTPSATKADVLVYTTEPLASDMEVIGPISAKLFASTSARDTDWMVRLVDVGPNGTAAFLCDGVLRARCRDPQNGGRFRSDRLSEIRPGEVYEYTIDFWRGTANLFKKGHRVRIEISSSFYPYYLRNLNTGEDNIGFATQSVQAQQRLSHNKQYPSHIVLPLAPRE